LKLKPKKMSSPAVVEFPDFDAAADAQALRKAMKGFGTNEDDIIEVLAGRTNAQRQEIAAAFNDEFDRDLVKDLKSELRGKLERICVGLMRSPASYDAYCLHKAMKGAGTDEEALIEVLCTRYGDEIEAAGAAYAEEYKDDLAEDIRSEVRGDFERLVASLVENPRPRDEEGDVDESQAELDANELLEAGEKKRFGTDEKKFIEILTQRGKEHLRVVFQKYAGICDYDIERSIDREMGGNLARGLIAIVNWVRGPEAWFAERLYQAMDGLGTDDKDLQRVLISRSEIDLAGVATAFNKNHEKYKKTLQHWIKDDISGDYQKIMMTLLQGFE